ncbi:MAG: hypothetical protein ACFFCD_03705 [Promethearchaeota archaeon]
MIIQVPDIKKMVYQAYPNLTGLAKAHVEGLENIITLYTNTIEEFIRRHCEQIYRHLDPEPDNEQQKLVKQKLLEICHEIESRKTLEEVSNVMLTEDEATEIMTNFEKEMFHKCEKDEKLTLDDYVSFARKYGYSIGKVLIASAWLDEYFSRKAIETRDATYEKVTLA